MYQLSPNLWDGSPTKSVICLTDGAVIPFSEANTDYANFKKAVLEQEPGGAVVEDGESFSLNTNPDASILEDADGNVMTIEQAKEYVRTLP
jgi:hypothetical protein